MPLWNILASVAILFLILSFFGGRNAIWGGLCLGVLIAVVTGAVNYFSVSHVSWSLLKKIVVVCVLAGVVFEIIGRVASINSPQNRMEREIKEAKKRIRKEMKDSF